MSRLRIIPARAGFTFNELLGLIDKQDHPRSRGVYRTALPGAFSRCGSSPLARGLQGDEGGWPKPDRIIPARAGFTIHGERGEDANRDHPRSRGVYSIEAALLESQLGSSPLARGLQLRHVVGGDPPRIIPARAGFTGPPAVRKSPGWDHPRSRGVYPSVSMGRLFVVGSSPLARGLRDPPILIAEVGRIIPARAGFTPGLCVGGRRVRDHPRSRGVYRRTFLSYLAAHGSSPLARGLRGGVEVGVGLGRIIPARAGFTRGVLLPGRFQGDHPRSRGVYGPLQLPVAHPQGSSPLARGLRSQEPAHAQPRGLGIIPARAGFTFALVRRGFRRRDHPRSRGVYSTRVTGPPSLEGSSPLARGLLSPPPRRGSCHRIIPARAGFTRHMTHRTQTHPDHPRSRGVYNGLPAQPAEGAGSSPLARGLLRVGQGDGGGVGIIPARAGFTMASTGRRRGGCGSSPLARGLHLRILGIPTNP